MISADLLTADEREQILAIERAPQPIWEPNPGPQTVAYNSLADIIGYGGAAGGGKTELCLGLALTKHKRSLFLRRTYKELLAINDRITSIIGSRDGHSGQDHVWRPPSLPGVQIEYGSVEHCGVDGIPRDEQGYQGRPHDLLVFDEAAQFPEFSVVFLSGWIRSEDPTQKCRMVLPMNPPMDTDGEWVIDFFGPWLDDTHPDPALPGELRWFVMHPVTNKFIEVPNDTAVHFPEAVNPKERKMLPKSRTFVFSQVDDNPYYANSGYKTTLMAMPEPLRSRLLRGEFKRNITDSPFQVIPTAWIETAMARWVQPARLPRMDSVGVDVARGGKDNTVIAARHQGNWYAPLKMHPGATTPDGPAAAGLVAIVAGRDRPPIHVDVIGVGASVVDSLRTANFQTLAVNVAEKANGPDRTGTLTFANKRAEMVWRMRDLLDPESNSGTTLPPDPLLKQELTAYRWQMRGKDILLEDTDSIKERIGRSPDRATAICLAAIQTPRLSDFTPNASAARRQYDPLAEARATHVAQSNNRRNYVPFGGDRR